MHPPRPDADAGSDGLNAGFDALVTAAGGDPVSSRGRNVRESMHAALKRVPDGETTGVSRSLKVYPTR